MFLWYVGMSLVLVAWVFDSPMLDYRLVMAGSVLPLIERLTGGPWVLHGLAAPVLVMTVVMVGLRGRRLAQRRWLGLPIGMFVFCVLSGSWSHTEVFWWPLFGFTPDAADLPSWPPVPLGVAAELAGVGALAYAVRRYGLDRREARIRFARTGHLPRSSARN